MRAKGLHPGNCLWCLGDQCLAPVWPWGRDPSSPLPVVQHSPCHKSQMGFRESSRMFPYAQYPKWWEKIHTRKKKKSEKTKLERLVWTCEALTLWGDAVTWQSWSTGVNCAHPSLRQPPALCSMFLGTWQHVYWFPEIFSGGKLLPSQVRFLCAHCGLLTNWKRLLSLGMM